MGLQISLTGVTERAGTVHAILKVRCSTALLSMQRQCRAADSAATILGVILLKEEQQRPAQGAGNNWRAQHGFLRMTCRYVIEDGPEFQEVSR